MYQQLLVCSTAWWTVPVSVDNVPSYPHHSHPQDRKRPLVALLNHLLVDGIDAGQRTCKVS